MNDNKKLKTFSKENYLAELELKKKNANDNVAAFFFKILQSKKDSFLLNYKIKGMDLIFP